MRIISGVVPGVSRLARLQELSKKARQRLKWFDYYKSRAYNARLTCRHFDISPQTFYRWKRRYNPRHLESLEDHSHRPRHLRQTYSTELVEAVLRLREGYPRWGKDKLVVQPLDHMGLKLTQIDKYATEMHNPEITEPQGKV